MAVPSRLCVLVNPRAGGGRARRTLTAVQPVFEQAGTELDVRLLRCPGHAREAVATLPAGEHDGVCVLGGDGTIHEVVNGLMAREEPAALTMGVVPAGSGNALAHDLGLLDPREAARVVAAGASRPLDLMRVTGPGEPRYAFNIVGWGGAADAGRWAERLRRLGPGRYALANLMVVLAGRRRAARLTFDGETRGGRFLFVLACNTRHTGAGMPIAPEARLDDGLLDLVVVSATSRGRLLSLLRKVPTGRHREAPEVGYHRISRFSLATSAPEALNLDGEIAGSAPMEVSVVPAALRLYGPE